MMSLTPHNTAGMSEYIKQFDVCTCNASLSVVHGANKAAKFPHEPISCHVNDASMTQAFLYVRQQQYQWKWQKHLCTHFPYIANL